MKVRNSWKTQRDSRNSRLTQVFGTREPEAVKVAERIHWVFGYDEKRVDSAGTVRVRRPLVAPQIETPVLIPAAQ